MFELFVSHAAAPEGALWHLAGPVGAGCTSR